MRRLSADAGSAPTLTRLAIPVVDQKNIAWNPDNGTFDLYVHSDEEVTRQVVFRDRRQLWLRDSTVGDPVCGGPNILAVTLPENEALTILGEQPVFVLQVQDVEKAKAAKLGLTAARALRVEFLLRVDGYGATGSSCVLGNRSKEYGYEAHVIATRLVDAKGQLTNWTSEQKPVATLTR